MIGETRVSQPNVLRTLSLYELFQASNFYPVSRYMVFLDSTRIEKNRFAYALNHSQLAFVALNRFLVLFK